MKKSALLLVCASAAVAALAAARRGERTAADSPRGAAAAAHGRPVPPPEQAPAHTPQPEAAETCPNIPRRPHRGPQPQPSPEELKAWFVAELEKLEREQPDPPPAKAAVEEAAQIQAPPAGSAAAEEEAVVPEQEEYPFQSDEDVDEEAPEPETDEAPEMGSSLPADATVEAAGEGGGFWTDNIYLDSNLGVSFSLPDNWLGGGRVEAPAQPRYGADRHGLETMLHRSETVSAGQFAPGSWSGSVYTNHSLELEFRLPEGWSVCTPEEVAANFGVAEGVHNEMAVQDPTVGNNLLLMTQDLSGVIGGGSMTAEAYARMLRRQLEDMEELSYRFGEGRPVALAGRTWWSLTATVCDKGGDLEQDDMHQVFFFHKLGTTMVVLNCFLMAGTTEDVVLEAVVSC